jgi:hypothetical protein
MATYLSWPSIRLLQAHVGLQLFEFGINACTRSIEKPAEQQIAYEKMPYGADRTACDHESKMVMFLANNSMFSQD